MSTNWSLPLSVCSPGCIELWEHCPELFYRGRSHGYFVTTPYSHRGEAILLWTVWAHALRNLQTCYAHMYNKHYATADLNPLKVGKKTTFWWLAYSDKSQEKPYSCKKCDRAFAKCRSLCNHCITMMKKCRSIWKVTPVHLFCELLLQSIPDRLLDTVAHAQTASPISCSAYFNP